MNARLIAGALALLGLAACADRMGDYPSLLPTDQVLAEPVIPAHARGAANDPQAGLSGRAAGLSARSAASPASSADLNRRAQALRTRAEALSKTSLDECAPDDAECTTPTPQE